MSTEHTRPAGRKGMRRAVVALPNGFTLFNLFCGIYAIVLSSRRTPADFDRAALFIVLGGIADVLDGRIARATGTGSRMGEELDSLVDAISFGLAPALMMYFVRLDDTGWDWIFAFLFTACAVMRLARFNVEQAGRAKTHFHGLPSPAAGLTLASYYSFSQTSYYNDAIIFFTDAKTLALLPWHTILRFLMIVLAFLMVSNVPYPAVPTIGFRSVKQAIGTVVVVGSLVGVVMARSQFVFPALLAYVTFGVVNAVVVGFVAKRRALPEAVYWSDEEGNGGASDLPRRPSGPRPTDPGTDDDATEPVPRHRTPVTPLTDEALAAKRRKRRRRGHRPGHPTGGAEPSSPSSTTPPSPKPPPPAPDHT